MRNIFYFKYIFAHKKRPNSFKELGLKKLKNKILFFNKISAQSYES